MTRRHLEFYTTYGQKNLDDTKLWKMSDELLNRIEQNKLQAALKYYKQIRSRIELFPVVWVLATLHIIPVKLKLGKKINIQQLNNMWKSLEHDKIVLWDLMAEIQMEVVFNDNKISKIEQTYEQFFINHDIKPQFTSKYFLLKYYYRANIYDSTGKLYQAISTLNKAKKYCGSTEWNLKIRKSLGTCYGKLGDYGKATKYFADILAETSDTTYPYIRIQVLNNLSILANKRNDYKQAKSYSQYCLELCNKYQFNAFQFRMLYNEATGLIKQGKFKDALVILLFLEQEHYDHKNFTKLVMVKHNIAMTYGNSGDFEKAVTKLEEMKELNDYMSEQLQISTELNQIDLYLQLGKFKLVRKKLYAIRSRVEEFQSLELSAFLKLLESKYQIYGRSDILDMNNIKEVVNFASKQGDHNLLAWARYFQAIYYELQGDYFHAREKLVKAIQHAEYVNNPIMYSRFLIYQIIMFIKTDETGEIKNKLEMLLKHRETYDYPIIRFHAMLGAFIVRIHSEDEIEYNQDKFTIEKVFHEILRNEYSQSKIKLNLLEYLVKQLVRSDQNIPRMYWDEIIGHMETIAKKCGSMYLLGQLYMAKAHISATEDDLNTSQQYLDDARDLFLDIGSSGQLDDIAYQEIMNSQRRLGVSY